MYTKIRMLIPVSLVGLSTLKEGHPFLNIDSRHSSKDISQALEPMNT